MRELTLNEVESVSGGSVAGVVAVLTMPVSAPVAAFVIGLTLVVAVGILLTTE